MDHETSSVDGSVTSPAAAGGGVVEGKKSKMEQIIDEVVTTETTYIKDLTDIIDGYETPVVDNLDTLQIPDEDVLALFNNIEEIRDFGGYMLKTLEKCHYDVKRIGNCFVSIWETESDAGLKLYSDYCSLYPNTVEVLTKCMKTPVLGQFFKDCQTQLGHMLPLGAYLIKPVQRVLKYSLLLEKLDKCLTAEEEGKGEIKAAFNTMTQVAEHINEVKKDYETTLLVQEIQSQLIGWEGNDLMTYGSLVEQDTFKYLGGKTTSTAIHLATERHLLLFDELLLLTKKKEDHFVYHHHINVENLQVDGRIPRFPLCFELYEVSTDKVFAFIADTLDHKLEWVKQVDKVIERKLHLGLSDRTKLLLLAGMDARPGRGALQRSYATFDAELPESRSHKKKSSEDLMKRQRKKMVMKKSSSLMLNTPVNCDPFVLYSGKSVNLDDGKEKEAVNKSEKQKSVYLLKRSQSAHSSLDSHHDNDEVVSKVKLLKDVLHEENDNTATVVAIQRRKVVRRRKISAPQFTGSTTSHSTDSTTNTVTQPAIHNDNGSNNKMTPSALKDNHTSSSTNDDGVDELSRVLAEQQVDYDDLSEMRAREPSIVLPPPSDFTVMPEQQHYYKSTDDNGRIIITPTTSSSSKHHDEQQKIEQRREHMDINTWIV